jgi:hypothetical protein
MAATNFTPIQLYRSSTAAAVPLAADLAAGELAINTTDEKLYFENASGTVKLLASSAATGGTFTTVTATTVVNGLGAVGTPSYTFTGDLNTGMWSPAADTIAFSEGGAEAMRIDSSGSVGIGTSSPAVRLELVTTSAGATAEVLRLNNPGGGVNTAAQIKFNAAGQNYASITGGFGAAAPQMTFNLPTSAGNYVWQQASTESMRLDAAGNVGIGTSAPTAKLDVAAAAFTGGPLIGARYNTTNLRMGIGIANANGFPFVGVNVNNAADDNGTFDINARAARLRMDSGTFQFETSSVSGTAGNAITWNTSAYIDASGNVGIGNTSPTCALDVTGQIATRGAVGGFVVVSRDGSGADWSLYNPSGDDLRIFGNSADRLTVTNAGDVGIGTSAPAVRLDVSGGGIRGQALDATGSPALFTSTGGGVLYHNGGGAVVLRAYANASGTAGELTFNTNAAERMRIDGSGNVLIGSTAASGLGTKTKFSTNGGAGAYNGSIGSVVGSGTGAIDTAIPINQYAGGAAVLLMASRNTSNGTNTDSAVYMVRFFYDGNNAPTTTFIAGTNFLTFGVSGSQTLTVTNAGGGNASYAWFGNK